MEERTGELVVGRVVRETGVNAVWTVEALVDDDGHLNVYVTTDREDDRIRKVSSGQGDGNREQLALRFTTARIEKEYRDFMKKVL